MEELQVRRAAAIAFGLCVSACGGGGAKYVLEGSLSAVMDLNFDKAVLEQSGEDVSVRYVRVRGATEDTQLKVAWAFAGEAFNPPATLDLAQPRPDDMNQQRGVLSRNVQNDPRQNFPRLERGSLILYGVPTPGKSLKVEMRATIENGSDPSSGRTVFGTVSAEVPKP